MRTVPSIAAIVALATTMTLALAAQELESKVSPTAGIAIGVPQGWISVPLPTGIMGMTKERNERGQPLVTLNVSKQDLAGQSFADFRAEQIAGAQRRTKEGDEHSVAAIEHPAGPGFVYRRITTATSGQRQAVYSYYIEAANGVWFVSWIVPPSDEPGRFDALAAAVVKSLRPS